MKSILLISNMGPSEQHPNSGIFIANQYNELRKNKELSFDYFYLTQDKKHGLAKILRYPLFLWQFISKYIFNHKKIDLIHVHFYYPNIILAALYKLLRNRKLRIVVTFHGSDIYYYTPAKSSYRFFSLFVDQYIFVSSELKKRFYKAVDGRVISAGALDLFYKLTSEKDKKYDLLFVGHLDFNKGIDRLLKLADSLENSVRIAVVGQGDSTVLDQYINNGSIAYLGPQTPDRLKEIYSRSRFLLNLSRNESFGLVLTEAMAQGVPVIATQTDGAATQISDNENGFLLKNDCKWLQDDGVAIIKQVLNSNQLKYKILSQKAAESAQRHKLSNITNELITIYNDLL
ncbi:glycosyltransferase family 4 protein [Pseudoalteromonas ulvae]|uniref:Glycosyl transferase family 1 domain-containing protein n=1 Tax=Pseudoalteromonas ulvae TaxID=107327 RepID=A0A244CQ03_PSEDV|nr:glycosyltransferase family 4 protein [Pseudoalteromonas ulvae]OUL57648.1 hypothetical protein B1199_11320 [Pseudoalteromonas ulvae]